MRRKNRRNLGVIVFAVSPDGKLYNIMRYDMTKTKERYGLALAYLVNESDPEAPLTFSHAIKFPANHSKFMIKKDVKSGIYYSLASRITDPEIINDRRLLSLMSSPDLINWSLVKDIYDLREIADAKDVGIQYVDFEIEGDDIIFLSRTAINKPHSFHDSNYITFHTIKNFKKISPQKD